MSQDTAQQLEEVGRRLADLRKRRDELVCQRIAEGASHRQVATEAGLSHGAVQRILERSR